MAKEDIAQIKANYAHFFNGGGGEHFIKKLNAYRESELHKADLAETPDKAFGHLKKAHGIIWVLEHIENMIEKGPSK